MDRKVLFGAAVVSFALVIPVQAAAFERSEQADADAASEFLAALVGEWSVVTEAVPGPGMDPIRTEGRETARLLGGWLIAESTREVRGRVQTSVRTLGFDPHHRRFVGTWIDSMQSHLWRHEGALDASGRVLTIETEGPLLGNPAQMVRYREIIEIDGNRRVIRSQIMSPRRDWFEFGRSEYRKRAPSGRD